MKIKSLKLENFSKYSQVEVDFDQSITYLIGKNGSGKSTLGLTGVQFMFEGIAEKASKGASPLIGERFRFIGPESPSAKGEMVLYDEERGFEIKVLRKLTSKGSELKLEAPDDVVLDQRWLSDLFNLFLIAPKKFIELSGKEQAIALGIDTSSIDKEIVELKSEYTLINRDIKSLGDPEQVEEIKPVDVGELNKQKNEINKFNEEQRVKSDKIKEAKKLLKELENERIELQAKLDAIVARIEKGNNVMEALPKPEPEQSTEAIDVQINESAKINEQAMKYKQYKVAIEKKEAKQKELEANKEQQKQKELEKVAVIKSKELPFDGMSVNNEGELLINDRPVKQPYFSSGELLKIVPILMSSTDPKLKYVFIQEFNLLDEDMQMEVEKYLTGKGFQLVIELVGKSTIKDRNCILLKDMEIVEEILDEDPFS
jgi:hypothetical protein